MLKVFRDNLKNLTWILWVIIAVFILALVADFGSGIGGSGGGNQAAAATVGKEKVSLAEFQREFRQLRKAGLESKAALVEAHKSVREDQKPKEEETG